MALQRAQSAAAELAKAAHQQAACIPFWNLNQLAKMLYAICIQQAGGPASSEISVLDFCL